MIDRFGSRVGHLYYLAFPGVGIFEFLSVPVTTNHFPGWGVSVILDFPFLPGGGEFNSNFLENVKSRPVRMISAYSLLLQWDTSHTTTSANSLKTLQNGLKHPETIKNTKGKQGKSV